MATTPTPEGPTMLAADPGPGPRTHRFMGVDMEVPDGVLAPREETEILGRAAVAVLAELDGPRCVVDMCCGSGNLACAISMAHPAVTVWACDLTEACVAVARRNADRLGLAGRVRVRRGDLFAPLPVGTFGGMVDLVMCNPPYISTGRLGGDRAHLLASEPREAFDGGPYGLSLHQRVIGDSLRYLRPNGWLALEFGEGQARQLAMLFRRSAGYGPVTFFTDALGGMRVALARKLA